MENDSNAVNSCGMFANTFGSHYDCADETLMSKHGVIGEGCAGELIDDSTGEPVDVKICYCQYDGCNKNCTCQPKERMGDENANLSLNPTENSISSPLPAAHKSRNLDFNKLPSQDFILHSSTESVRFAKLKEGDTGTTKADSPEKSEPDFAEHLKSEIILIGVLTIGFHVFLYYYGHYLHVNQYSFNLN